MSRFGFRAWNPEAKIMSNEFGFSSIVANGQVFEKGQSFSLFADYNDVQAIVMQSTGLHDKSGKLIFEGDIIETRFIFGKDIPRGQIKFEDGCFVVKWINDEEGLNDILSVHGPNSEIIGNVHENPGLA